MTEENEIQGARPPVADGPDASAEGSPLPPLQLSLPGFEGPIDLLLRLTERAELDITTVSLVAVTAQYLQHFRAQPWADAIALGDFVATAARLLLLKSRSLLPGSTTVPPSDDDGAEDEQALKEALADYRLFRHAAAELDERVAAGSRLYPRVVPTQSSEAEPPLKKVPVEQLILMLQQALSRFPEPELPVALPAQLVSIDEKVDEIRSRLRRDGVVGFMSVVQRCRSRLEVVVTFIAILHLIRDGEIEASQAEPFGDITLAAHSAEAAC